MSERVELNRETKDYIRNLANAAADEVAIFASIPDAGTRDALNLMVNVICFWTEDHANASVEDVIEACYEGEDDDIPVVEQVRSWIEDS